MQIVSRKRLGWLAGLAVLMIILMWPAGNWLQCREYRFEGSHVDAVYLVGGGRDHDRRVEALCRYVASEDEAGNVRLLIARNESISRYNRTMQRNLTYQEWAVFRIKEFFEQSGRDAPDMVIVPGEFTGTDGEMEALAEYLAGNPDIVALAVVTSPFHFRRTIGRLRLYLKKDLKIKCVPACSEWIDRAPWIVALELGKMTRDAMGLSRVRFLSREKSVISRR